MATAAATTTSSLSAKPSSSSHQWISQSSRNIRDRALPTPPRTFTPPLQAFKLPEYDDEKVEKLVARALPSPPRAATPTTSQDHENIYEEITDDFILKALQRNKIKMAQKYVPNKEDDYGFVCTAQEMHAMDSNVKQNLPGLVPAREGQANQNVEDNMIIPPDAKYNAPRSSARSLVQGCLSSATLDDSKLKQEQAFGFIRGCANPCNLPARTDCSTVQSARLAGDNVDMQSSQDITAGYPPPPTYSQSQEPIQNFLPHCHPMSQSQQYMCMSSSSHMSQSSTPSHTTLHQSVLQGSLQASSRQHHQYHSQNSLNQFSANPPLPPKLVQQTHSVSQPKYPCQAPFPPSCPSAQQSKSSMAQHPPPDYSAHQGLYPSLANPRQNLQSNTFYPPNYPSNLLPSQSVPNLHSLQSSQAKPLISSSSSSTLSSHSHMFYSPATNPAPHLLPCHTPTETDPTWCPYGSRPPSSLYMSDCSAPYSTGSDSGISVCSERAHPFSASVMHNQLQTDHQHTRTDVDYSRIMGHSEQFIPSERRHSLVNLNESRSSDYLMPNCVHATDEGFSELHCYHQQQMQQQAQQQMQQQAQQQMQQQAQQQMQQHVQQLYEKRMQKQRLQQQIHEQRLQQQQQIQEHQIYKQHLQMQQQHLKEQQLLKEQQHQEEQLIAKEKQSQLQQQEESIFVQRAREKIYQKLKHLDLAHPDYNQLEFSPVPWSPPPSESGNSENPIPPPPLPPPREPQVFKSISLSKGLQHFDLNVLSPSRDVPPPLPARLKRVHVSRKPLPVVPQEKEEEEEEEKSYSVFERVKPVEYKGDDIIGITGGLDRLQVFHRQQGARKVIPRAHSTDTESEYGSRTNSRDVRSTAKDKRASSKGDTRAKSKESRAKSRDSRSVSKETKSIASSERRSQSRRRRAKSLDKRSTSENKEKRASSSSSSETAPPPPIKTRHSSGSGKPPPLSVRNVSDSSSVYEERSPGIVNGTLSDLLRRNHDRLLLV